MSTLEFNDEKQKLVLMPMSLKLISGLDHARSVVRDLSTELSRKKTLEESRESYLCIKTKSKSLELERSTDE